MCQGKIDLSTGGMAMVLLEFNSINFGWYDTCTC